MVRKNYDPFVFGPALAIDKSPINLYFKINQLYHVLL